MAPPTNKIVISLDCDGCPNKITDRLFMTCSTCKCNYDLICANVSNTRFYIMEPEKKKSWNCIACISKRPKGNNMNTPVGIRDLREDRSNITLRKPRTLRCQSLENLSLNNSKTFHDSFEDTLYCDTSSNAQESTANSAQTQLKNEVKELTSHLIKAKEEINKLLSEKNELKLTIDKLQKNKTSKQPSKRSPYKNTDVTRTSSVALSETLPSSSFPALPITPNSIEQQLKSPNTKQDPIVNSKSLSYRDCLVSPPGRLYETKSRSGLDQETPKHSPRSLSRTTTKNCKASSTQDFQKPNSDMMTEKRFVQDKRPKIMIFGDQCCKDLSPILIKLRGKHRNAKDYRIINYTYPDAPAEYILQSVRSDVHTLNEDDWVILCLGSNDTNPTKFLIEVSAILKTLTKPEVIVLGIAHNPHLNENKINDNLKTIVYNQKNCKYLHVISSKYTPPYNISFIKRINGLINTHDYEACYLGKNITRMRHSKTDNHQRPAPGTIPYFFNKISSASQKNLDTLDIGVTHKTYTHRPGTIPFYFDIKTDTQNISPNKDRQQFFRVKPLST